MSLLTCFRMCPFGGITPVHICVQNFGPSNRDRGLTNEGRRAQSNAPSTLTGPPGTGPQGPSRVTETPPARSSENGFSYRPPRCFGSRKRTCGREAPLETRKPPTRRRVTRAGHPRNFQRKQLLRLTTIQKGWEIRPNYQQVRRAVAGMPLPKPDPHVRLGLTGRQEFPALPCT